MEKKDSFYHRDVQVVFWGEVSRKDKVCGFAECITLMMLKMGCFWRLPPDFPCKWLCLPIPAHATPLTRAHLQCFSSTCLGWSFDLWWSVPVDLFIFFSTSGSLGRRKCNRRFVMELVGFLFNKKRCPGSSWWEWAARCQGVTDGSLSMCTGHPLVLAKPVWAELW